MSTLTRQGCRWLGSALLAGLMLALTPTLAAAQAEVIEYYATDAVGSTRVVFAPDGNVKARSDYLPFGEALGTTGSLPAQRFTGQERDGEAGRDNFNARGLVTRTGRFAALDPVGGTPGNPQTWNRYAYVSSNPLSYTDPTGEQAEAHFYTSVTVRSPSDQLWWYGGYDDAFGGGGSGGGDYGGGTSVQLPSLPGTPVDLPSAPEAPLPPADAVVLDQAVVAVTTFTPSEKCETKVLRRLGVTMPQVAAFTGGPRSFQDGTASQARMNGDFYSGPAALAGRAFANDPRNAGMVSVADMFAARPGMRAMTAPDRRVFTAYFRPGSVKPGHGAFALVFHEALHPLVGVDTDIQKRLNIRVNENNTANITRHVQKNCKPQ